MHGRQHFDILNRESRRLDRPECLPLLLPTPQSPCVDIPFSPVTVGFKATRSPRRGIGRSTEY
jgi:hypothetical protein